MRRVVFLSLAALSFCEPGLSARGALIQFDTRTAFDAATTNQTIIDFSGLAPANGFAYFGTPGSLTLSGVNFATPNGPLFVQNDGVSSRLTVQQGTPTSVLDVTLPAGTTAVGFDFLSGDPLTITFVTGEAFDLGSMPGPDYGFAGFISDQAISSISLESLTGTDYKNFTFGQAVPEPSSVVMLGAGALGFIGYVLRRRPTA
jgi:PEP-CTERM motif